MLVDKFILTKWNSRTKYYYESLGYQYTRMGDSLKVKIIDLKENSVEKVNIKCDYCYNTFITTFSHRNNSMKNSIIKKDACNNCKHLKAREGVSKKYGVSHYRSIKGVDEKRKSTILSKYGVDNVFKLEEVKNKIKKTFLEKYGNSVFVRTVLYNIKRKATSIRKYGKDSHMKTKKYRDAFTGKNSPNWKGGINDPRWDRLSPKYREWRTFVFRKNSYTCQKCMIKGGKLEAHHIFNWNDNPDKRYETNNGITFCIDCHTSFHKIYGKKNNDKKQLIEFLK